MFAIYFSNGAGPRLFVAAVDDVHSALSMAKLLSRQDPRDVVVIENRIMGDTELIATFRRGVREDNVFESEAPLVPRPDLPPGRTNGPRDRV